MRGSRVMDTFGGKVRCMRRFWRRKNAKVNTFTIDMNARLPFADALVPADANVPAPASFVRTTLVVGVLLVRDHTEIDKAVVRPDSVDVVHLPAGKFSVNKRPDYPVRLVHLFAIPELDIPVGVQTFCRPAGAYSRQGSCGGVVRKRLSKMVNIDGTHGAIVSGVNYYGKR